MLKEEILAKLCQLSDAERAILDTLAVKPMKVSQLVKTQFAPRSTIVDSLERLRKRGLARPVAMGKHTEWKLVNQAVLAEKFLSLAELLQERGAFEEMRSSKHGKVPHHSKTIVYTGWRNIIKAYEQEMMRHAGERVYGIQSTSSARDALAKATPKAFLGVNEAIKKHKIILEAIISPSMLELYKGNEEEWLKSLEGRAHAYRLVSDDLLNFSADIFIFSNKVLFTNWNDEELVVLRNKDIVAAQEKLFHLMFATGKQIDQNLFIRTLVQE